MEDMKNTNEIAEEMEDINVTTDEESEGGNLAVLAFGLGACVIAGVSAWIYKNRDKLEAKRVERMRKKGYIVYKPEVVKDDTCDTEDEE